MRVADRAADDQAERQRGQPRGARDKPYPQQRHRDGLEREQRPLPERALLLEPGRS